MLTVLRNLIYTLTILCLSVGVKAQSEDSNVLIVKLKELSTTTNFTEVVDSIQKSQAYCDYYNDTLFWKASVKQKGEKFILLITMVSNLGILLDVNADNVYGIYSQSGEPIIVIGEDASKLFSCTEKIEEIRYKNTPEVIIEEDYPLWVYESENDLIWKLKEDYLFPCD